jgi:hypothetical protein
LDAVGEPYIALGLTVPPTEMPTKYELIISVVAAKALGLDVPAKLLALE